MSENTHGTLLFVLFFIKYFLLVAAWVKVVVDYLEHDDVVLVYHTNSHLEGYDHHLMCPSAHNVRSNKVCVKHFIYYYYYYYISNSYLNWACACRGRVERRKRRDIRWCKPFTPAEVHPITNQLRLNKATCAACNDWIRYCSDMYCTLIHTIAGKVPLVLCSVRHKVPLPTHHSLSRPSVGSQPGASKTWRREYLVWEQWTPRWVLVVNLV